MNPNAPPNNKYALPSNSQCVATLCVLAMVVARWVLLEVTYFDACGIDV